MNVNIAYSGGEQKALEKNKQTVRNALRSWNLAIVHISLFNLLVSLVLWLAVVGDGAGDVKFFQFGASILQRTV